jgi:hypothetical protein
MAAVMTRNSQDPDSDFQSGQAEKPAPDWVEQFFARSNPTADTSSH